MRWIIVALVLVTVLFSAGASFAEEGDTGGMGHGLKRAAANIGLGWLEVPRGIVYENAKIPVVGLGLGLVKGAGLTVWRTSYGVIDLVTLGLISGDRLYSDEMPEFVWDANWLPKRGEQPAKSTVLEKPENDTIK